MKIGMMTVHGATCSAVLEMVGQRPDSSKSITVVGWIKEQKDDHVIVKFGSQRPDDKSRYNRVPRKDIERIVLMEVEDEDQGTAQQ